MDLYDAQKLILKNYVLPILVTKTLAEVIADLNAPFSPAYWVLRTSLGKHELVEEPGVDADGVTVTNFIHGGATGGYINRSPGERDDFNLLFNSVLSCKPSLANVRTAFDDIFSGTGAGAQGCRAHVKAKSRRKCTVGEKLFVAQTVGGPVQAGARGSATNPDTLAAEGAVTENDVISALSV